MCQTAYVLVSPDSGFSHSQLSPVSLSPLLVPELPWALLCGYKERQAVPGLGWTCRWGAAFLREPIWTIFVSCLGLLHHTLPYTPYTVVDTHAPMHTTQTHTYRHMTCILHTTYKSTHHIQKHFSIWLCNCPAHSGIWESCRFVVTVHFNWDSHIYPLCSAQTSDPDLDWPLFHLIHNSRAAR